MTLKSYIIPEQDYNKLKARNKVLNKLVRRLNSETNYFNKQIEKQEKELARLTKLSEKKYNYCITIILSCLILSLIIVFINL